MAQRFGRNQRRRARAQVATLQQEVQNLQLAIEMDNALLNDLSKQKSALSEAMREARHVLGESVALPAQESRYRPNKGETSFDIDPMTPLDFNSFSRSTLNESTTLQIERMHLLLTRVQRESLSAGLHCRVYLGKDSWAYAISESAINSLSPEMLERRLLPEISRQFARLIPQHIGKRRSWPR